MSSGDELDLLRTSARGALAAGPSDALESLGGLGLLGLLVPEEAGGAGWCPIEATVVADEVGRALAERGASASDASGTAPSWTSTSVAAAALAGEGHRADWLATTLDGTRPAVAVAGRLRVDDQRASGVLTGVELADRAPAVIVLGPASTAVAADLSAPGVDVAPDPTSIDTTAARWRVELRDVPVDALAVDARVGDAARLLASATSLGSLRAAVERLTTYLADRRAFGAPISSFQAIQHRIVDLTLLEIRAGVTVDAAARALAVDPVDGGRLCSVAHGFVAERIPPALDECIQLTGGIGFTWEYPLHHELRRSVVDGVAFGSARASRERVLLESGWL